MLFKKKMPEPAADIPFRAYTGADPYVFISYAHKDSRLVFPIINELHRRGILMWYDEGIEPGADWQQFLAEKINGCSKFILFVSPDSVSSHHCRQEINFANTRGKQMLPIYLKSTELNAGMEMTLSVFQSVFYYAFKNNDEGFFETVYNALTTNDTSPDLQMTILEDISNSKVVLKLDSSGDKQLPSVIPLPEHGEFTVGRHDVTAGAQRSDFEFAPETKNISRRHAIFKLSEQEYTVTDLGSKAGTWVNGEKIPINTPITLINGQNISFGNAGADYFFMIT